MGSFCLWRNSINTRSIGVLSLRGSEKMNYFQRIKGYQLVLWTLLVGMLISGRVITYAAEELQGTEQTTTYIYHNHIGSKEEGSGCYGQPVYHSHAGNETDGGSCYTTPVYHSHIGNEADGGDCFNAARYHVHEGDGTEATGCYVPVYHTHSSGCYKEISSGDYGCYTVRSWDTSEGDYEGHDFKYYEMSCGRTIHGTNSAHTHSALDCGRGSEITGYTPGCNLTEESIVGYSLSCDKTDETIDGYSLSCTKTTDDIDGYERNCGKEEEIPYGAIIVTKQTVDTIGAMAFAEIEDYTEGELQLSDSPLCWYDGQGNIIGTGDSISVSSNGIYKVKADITNEDIDKESLWAQVTVDNIVVQDYKDSGNGRNDGEDEEKENGNDEASDENLPSSEEVRLSSPTPTPTPVPTVAPQKSDDTDRRNKSAAYERNVIPKIDEKAAYRLETEEQGKVTPTPHLKKEKAVIKTEEKMSVVPPLEEQKEIKKATFLSSPAAKVMMLTAGSFLLLTGLFLMWYLFRQSVRVYNDDGQGNMKYLGRCMVQLTEEGYLLVLAEQMTEKAYTNRYLIRPGLFAVGKREEELLIEKQEKRISTPLQKEMIVVI